MYMVRMHEVLMMQCRLPRSRAVHKRECHTRQATSARRGDELAVDALREGTLDASHLARGTGRAGAQRCELGVERLCIFAVLEGERRSLVDDGASGGEHREGEGENGNAEETHVVVKNWKRKERRVN